MSDAIQRLVTIQQVRAANARADARSEVERQRQALAAKRTAMSVGVGPSRPLSMDWESTSVARLAVRLRAFRSTLAPDEAALLDDWLDRAARPS